MDTVGWSQWGTINQKPPFFGVVRGQHLKPIMRHNITRFSLSQLNKAAQQDVAPSKPIQTQLQQFSPGGLVIQ